MTYPRRQTRITYEGISFLSILAFIILGSIMRQINLLVLLSGLMIAPFFFNWRLSRKMLERMRYKRIVPEWAHAGSAFVVEWIVHNERRRITTWQLKIADRIAPTGGQRKETEAVDLIVAQIEPGRTVSTTYRCLLADRGLYDFGPAIASSAFPVGLIRSQSRLADQQQLIVAPRLGRLTVNWQRLTQSASVGLRSKRQRLGLSDDEFYAIRPWRSGDARRLIHWRSTAKRGELMVKQYDERTDHDFGVILDLQADDLTPPKLVETAVSFLATVVNQLHQQIKGDAVVGICGEESWHMSDRMTRYAQAEILKRLATVQPAQETGIVEHLKQILDSSTRDTAMIVISTRAAPQNEEFSRWSAGIRSLTWIDLSNPSGQSYFQVDTDGTSERQSLIASATTKT